MANRHVLACFVCAFALVSAQVVKYALKGQEINLVPSIFGQPDDILWKHNGKKVVFFDGMEEFVFPPYENRLTLDWASAELTIQETLYEDSGNYELEVKVYKEVHRSQYTWELIDKVATPVISCEMSDAKQATLVCSTESKHPHLLEFKWSSNGIKQTGPNVTITLEDEDDDQVYRCDVSNPLSNETASFTAKDCFLEKRLAVLLAVIFGVIFAVLILLIMLGYLFRKRLRACFENTKKGVLKTGRSATEVSESSQGDESTYFLDGAPTLPSDQRLRPLIPTDWVDQGSEEKLDSNTIQRSNKELTGDEGVESDAAIGLTASSTDPLHSSNMNSSSELEDAESQQVTPEVTKKVEDDSPAEQRSSHEEDDSEKSAAETGREPVSNTTSRGEDQQEGGTSACEEETQSNSEDDEGIADEYQSENTSRHSLTDTPSLRKTNQDC
ncbi:uncharacterized protein LOC133537935 isoform X1 [Nerophis ophidion]|uniref:uncharacterized protein LOC133537935 isoform X1 n=1 Tax=Nerophis ophidion TaxID=159077 RepID=UPI002AE07606|nr:uncharacterized protein LOC133537935 isoform X1 [Nerophis ophidion]